MTSLLNQFDDEFKLENFPDILSIGWLYHVHLIQIE